jgi:uncharacterized alkaline shock family protein YloU
MREKRQEEEKERYEIPEIEEADHEDATRISEDVIVTIVATVLSEIEGVASASGGIVSGILGRKGASKGIKVEASDKEITIDVSVILDYGIRIPDVAANIQSKIRQAVEDMTGKYVRAVNVTIQGMRFPPTIEAPAEEEAAPDEDETPSETEETKENER